jgi:predicted NBD/HSP70 family sugar kinase
MMKIFGGIKVYGLKVRIVVLDDKGNIILRSELKWMAELSSLCSDLAEALCFFARCCDAELLLSVCIEDNIDTDLFSNHPNISRNINVVTLEELGELKIIPDFKSADEQDHYRDAMHLALLSVLSFDEEDSRW